MSLHIHRAIRSDHLVDSLGELLVTPLPDPFATEIVAVPTQGVERWLSQQLSQRLGISDRGGDGVCAGVDFSSPQRIVEQVSAEIIGADGEDDPWAPAAMVWPLLQVMDRCLSEEWCAPLAGFLARGVTDPGDPSRSGRRFSTARHLAELYAGYTVTRASMIQAWRTGQLVDGTGSALPDDLQWQARLWCELRTEIGVPSPAEQFERIRQALVDRPDLSDLPARISIFGLTRLPADHRTVFTALARHRDVHLWLPHASPALWLKVCEQLASAGSDHHWAYPLRRQDDPTAAIAQHRLLSYLGRDARELQISLLTADAVVDDHLHNSAGSPSGRPFTESLLGRLQADIAADRRLGIDPERHRLQADDRSIQVHASHGPDRQVEVLRELVVGLLADDPTLEPRDIVVMCPDIETYAPLISASFGLQTEAIEADHPGHRLRVRLADRSLRQLNPLLAVLSRLLELADSRMEISAVLDLCGQPPVARKFNLGEDDLERIKDLAIRSGIRWGLDADHRRAFSMQAFPHNTWSTGLARLLLGVAMSEDGQHFIGTTLPMDDVDSSDVDLVGRLAEFLDRLRTSVAAFSRRQSLASWLDAMRTALGSLTAVAAVDNWQITSAYGELARLAESAGPAEGAVELSLAEIRSLLAETFKGRPTRANFRTGTLTICTMMPMRSVPHRVIFLLGMDDGVFPRGDRPDGDDIAAREPQVGDRDRRGEDRQLLLDSIMAAEDHLIIIYSGADPRTNATKPPAVPLGELLDTLDLTAQAPAGRLVRDQVLIRHPLQPFDLMNFAVPGLTSTTAPFSFDTAALAGARASSQPRVSQSATFTTDRLPQLDTGEIIGLDDLIRFFAHPVRSFLRQRAGIARWSDEDPHNDEMPIELDGLESWAIGDRLLHLIMQGVPSEQAVAAEWRRGEIPPQQFGARILDKVCQGVQQVMETATPFLEQDPAGIDVSAEAGEVTISGTLSHLRGNSLVIVHYSRLSARHRLTAWIELLALTASHPDQEWRAVTIGRGGRSILGPVPPVFAQRVLTDLVQLYQQGSCEPLPLPPRVCAEYARLRRAGRSIDTYLPRLNEWWQDDQDDAYRAFFEQQTLQQILVRPSIADEERGTTAEPSRFGTLARRIWQPLLDSEELV